MNLQQSSEEEVTGSIHEMYSSLVFQRLIWSVVAAFTPSPQLMHAVASSFGFQSAR